MRRPIDPRSQGSEPKRVHSRKESATLSNSGSLALETIVGAWNRIVKDHLSQGHRIAKGPDIDSTSYSIRLTYTYEWDNLNYAAEQAEWDAAIANYEQEMVAFKEYEERRKKNLKEASAKDLDLQILRAEHRLANLKAAKAGQPIPYPEG